MNFKISTNTTLLYSLNYKKNVNSSTGYTGYTGYTGPAGAGGVLGFYGAFYDNSTQSFTASSQTTILFNSTIENNNVSISQFSNVGLFIGVGSGTNTLAYSINSTGWTGLGTTIFTTSGNAIVYGNNMWIAGGQGTNSIAFSTTGNAWVGLGNTIFSTSGNGIIWTGTKFVAVGNGTSNTIAYSTNGTTWTGLSLSIFSSAGFSVTINNSSTIIASGYGTGGILWFGTHYTVGVGKRTNDGISFSNTPRNFSKVVVNNTGLYIGQQRGVNQYGNSIYYSYTLLDRVCHTYLIPIE